MTYNAFLPSHVALTLHCAMHMASYTLQPSSSHADYTLSLSHSDSCTILCQYPCSHIFTLQEIGAHIIMKKVKFALVISPGLSFLHPWFLRTPVCKLLEIPWWLLLWTSKSDLHILQKFINVIEYFLHHKKYFIIFFLVQFPITIAIRGLISTTAIWNTDQEIIVLENLL